MDIANPLYGIRKRRRLRMMAGGSGIGLALARQIAEVHEGGVALVAREDARGALARLWLPSHAATAEKG